MSCSLLYLCTFYLSLGISFATIDDMTSKSIMSNSGGIICYCEGCPHGRDDTINYCILRPGGQCFSAVEEVYNTESRDFESQRSFGCISESEQALLQCKGDLVPSYYGRSIQCCNFTDFCNRDLLPTYIPRDTPSLFDMYFRNPLFFITSLVIISLSLIALLIYFYFNCQKKFWARKFFSRKSYVRKLQKSQHILQDSMSTTGSGVGKPLLVQTTISRQFSRNYCLGSGRFTEVYVGDWNASKIVEKVFSSRSEDRWIREKNIYEKALLRHENILGYVASDILKSGLRAIYTDYHPIGSLHDYLDKVCLTKPEFLILARSAANGIHQLHTEIPGTERRPAVAHRDITSKNFLINANKECVISNFEIAITHIGNEDFSSDDLDLTLGTPRYMAPEVVNGTIDDTSFDAFKKADVYSLTLVLYEICQRCVTIEDANLKCEEHSLPFSNVLPLCPSLDDMRVLHSMKKPKEELLFIPTRWEDDELLNSLLPTLHECLHEYTKLRHSALRIRKKVDNLISLMN